MQQQIPAAHIWESWQI